MLDAWEIKYGGDNRDAGIDRLESLCVKKTHLRVPRTVMSNKGKNCKQKKCMVPKTRIESGNYQQYSSPLAKDITPNDKGNGNSIAENDVHEDKTHLLDCVSTMHRTIEEIKTIILKMD